MGSKAATAILCKSDDLVERKKFEENYEENYINVKTAIRYGYVDEIINPNDLLSKLSSALQELKNKKELYFVNKKHGNIPL